MDEHRDKLPRPAPASADTAASNDSETSRIPEGASEIYDLVEEDGALPAPAPEPPTQPSPRAVPEYPEEALSELRSLKAKLENKDRQIEQVMEAYRSKKQETEKLLKRMEKTERRKFEQSKGDFIARFVEVLDNLDRAIDSIENAFDPDSVLQGIMLVRSRLVQLLKEEGLEKIFVRGQMFDPSNSEAAGLEKVADESQDRIVLRELQPGYMLKGSLLRVARVVVGRHGIDEAGVTDPAEATTATRVPAIVPKASEAMESSSDEGEKSWEADDSGRELESGDEGLDFNEE